MHERKNYRCFMFVHEIILLPCSFPPFLARIGTFSSLNCASSLASWRQRRLLEKHWAHWKRRFEELPEVSALMQPGRRPSPMLKDLEQQVHFVATVCPETEKSESPTRRIACRYPGCHPNVHRQNFPAIQHPNICLHSYVACCMYFISSATRAPCCTNDHKYITSTTASNS